MKVLGFYIVTDGQRSDQLVELIMKGTYISVEAFREAVSHDGFNGKFNIADQVDFSRFSSYENTMLAFIKNVGGLKYITDKNSVVFITDKKSLQPHVLLVCIIFEGKVGKYQSASEFFEYKPESESGQNEDLPWSVRRILKKGEKMLDQGDTDEAVAYFEKQRKKTKHPAISTRLLEILLDDNLDPIRCIDILDEDMRENPSLITSREHVELFARSLYACMEAGVASEISGLDGKSDISPEGYIMQIVNAARGLGSPAYKLEYIEEGLNKRKVKESKFFKRSGQ